MPEPDDEIFIQQCLQGDREAFGMLVSRHQRSVFNVALRMTKSYQEAQDITQAVFIKAYENLASYDTRFKFFSWIYRMAVNESLNALKRRKRTVTLEDEPAIPAPGTAADRATEAEDHVGKALMQLKPDDRAVVILRHFLFFSYERIAEVLEIPEKTVKSRLYTARERLRLTLRERTG